MRPAGIATTSIQAMFQYSSGGAPWPVAWMSIGAPTAPFEGADRLRLKVAPCAVPALAARASAPAATARVRRRACVRWVMAASSAAAAFSASGESLDSSPTFRAELIPRGLRAGQPPQVARVDVTLLRGVAALWQPRLLLAAVQRVQVIHVLVDQAQRSVAVVRRAVAGHDVLGGLHQRRQAGERAAVLLQRAALVQHRDLDRGDVVAAHEHLAPRGRDRHSVR